MLTTYYKTPDPGGLAAAEYYQFFIRAEKADNTLVFFLDENHGWFDAEGKRAIHHRTLLTDGYPTWEEASEAMKAQLRYIAAQGYVHGFSHDPLSPTVAYYRMIDPVNLE